MHEVADGVYTRQSRYWQTNTGIIRHGDNAVLIDPGVFPDELAELAADIASANLTVIAGVTTHEHWDHILWATSLNAETPRYASHTCAAWAQSNQQQISRWLRQEEATYKVYWERDLVGRLEPVDHGRLTIEGLNAEFLALPGHTNGHSGLYLADRGVIFVGDMLSDIDPPSLSSGDPREIESYLATLNQLGSLIKDVEVIVPGHGSVCNNTEARRRGELDLAYLAALVEHVDRLPGLLTDEVIAATVESLEDERLYSDTGQQLHQQNVQALLAARQKHQVP